MEHRTMTLLLLLVCAVIMFTTTEGSVPNCCVELSRNLSCHTLKRVRIYTTQNTGGSCDVDAIIFHLKNNRYCADPKYLPILQLPKKNIRGWLKRCKKIMKKM